MIFVPRENSYRDIWLFIISAFLLWSAIQGQNTAESAKQAANQAKTVALQNHQLTLQNHHLALEIQRQRYDFTFNQCWYQNQRHNNTIVKLNRSISDFERHPTRKITKQQLKVSVRDEIAIVNAILPIQNCAHLAGKATN